MCRAENTIEEIIDSVRDNFKSLVLGVALDMAGREQDLSVNAKGIRACTDGESEKGGYFLSEDRVRKALSDLKASGREGGSFKRFVEKNALRGITAALREGLHKQYENVAFKGFVREVCGGQYGHFVEIVRFLRNVLSHNITLGVTLTARDLDPARERAKRLFDSGVLVFKCKYATMLPKAQGILPEYGFEIRIPLGDLKGGEAILDVVPLHRMYMLAEFACNLCEEYGQLLTRR